MSSSEKNSSTLQPLDESMLPDTPFPLFEHWLSDVQRANIVNPTAMALSTVDTNGQPFQRFVLLKQFSEKGFVFFTNLSSRKAQQIEGNNQVSLLFPWLQLERQVHITGTTQPLSRKDVLSYFLTRPRGSQLGAWVSKQSSPVSSRKILLSKFEEMKEKFKNHDVSLPPFWGGYLVTPSSIEFWQGGEHRLHDRFLYSRSSSDTGQWLWERLAP